MRWKPSTGIEREYQTNSEAVARARTHARRLGTPFRAVVGNVEDGTYIIPIETYDLVVVFHYLHRPLFRDIREGLKPGGAVVYQTYVSEHVRVGHPMNPSHLLRPGELREVFADWEILRYEEGTGVEPRCSPRGPSPGSSPASRADATGAEGSIRGRSGLLPFRSGSGRSPPERRSVPENRPAPI